MQKNSSTGCPVIAAITKARQLADSTSSWGLACVLMQLLRKVIYYFIIFLLPILIFFPSCWLFPVTLADNWSAIVVKYGTRVLKIRSHQPKISLVPIVHLSPYINFARVSGTYLKQCFNLWAGNGTPRV